MNFIIDLNSSETVDKKSLSSSKIGIFPGTFDPIHNGHLAFAKECLNDVDEVWFWPNSMNPHKKPILLPLRIEMVKLAFEHLELPLRNKFKIIQYNDVQNRGEMFKLLHLRFPMLSFWNLMGHDRLAEPLTYDPSLAHKETIILTRDLESRKALNIAFFTGKIIIYNDTLFLSSSQVKDLLVRDEVDLVKEKMPLAVFDYIKEKKLYKRE
jgi:cytidyltransferase-like protein